MLAERGLLTTGTRAELIERLRQAAPAPRAPAAAAAQEPRAAPELPEMTEGPEREVIRAIEQCTSASEVGAQLGRVVATWAGAPSSRILVAALRKADELNALPLAYAIVYQVRLYGTSQYAKRLTPAVYEQLVRSAMRLAGDRDVLVIAQRMMQDAIMPTVPTFAMLFQVLLRCGDRRQLWAWYSEYRARPRPAGATDAEAAVPESLEVAVRHFLQFRHPTKGGGASGGGPGGSGARARKPAPRSAPSQ